MTDTQASLANQDDPDAQEQSYIKPKILVVDDSKLIHVAIEKVLAKEFQLIKAMDGEDAWSTLRLDDQIQVIITDQGMPRLDGFGLISRIRDSAISRINEIPIIMITGAEEEQVHLREQALDQGATDFIIKPFDKAELLARARSYTKLDQTKRDLESTEDALAEQSTVDPITNVFNNRYFKDRGNKDLSFAIRHNQEMCVFVLEIDEMGDMLLTYGSDTINRLLIWVADIVKNTMRKEDTIARINESRFGVIAPTAEHMDAIGFCNRLREKIADTEFDNKLIPSPITVSIGVANFDGNPERTFLDICNVALERLKEGTENGGDVVIGSNPEEAMQQLRNAAKNQKLSLDTIVKLYHAGNTDLLNPYARELATSIFPLLEYCNETLKWGLDKELQKISNKMVSK